MKTNVGGIDRAIRIVLGLAIMAAGYYYGSWLGLLGLMLLSTGLCKICGLYSLLGVSTVKNEASDSQ